MKDVYQVNKYHIERVAENKPEYCENPLVMLAPGSDEDMKAPNHFRVKILVYLPHQITDDGVPLQNPILDVTNRPVKSTISEEHTVLPGGEAGNQEPIGEAAAARMVYARLFTIFYSTLNYKVGEQYDLWRISFHYKLVDEEASYPLIRVIKRNSDPETTRGTVTTTQDPGG